MDQLELISRATRLRRELGEDATSPIDIFSLALSFDNLSLFLYPLGPSISGMCIKSKDTCVIAINSSMSKGRQRFTLAHELYHYKYGNVGETTICSAKLSSQADAIVEQEADRFASYLLLPPGAYEDQTEHAKQLFGHIRQADLIQIEQQYGISHSAMLWRLINDGVITYDEGQSLKAGIIWAARRLGYDTTLYHIIGEENAERRVLGHYVKLADALLEQSKISIGKYTELLLAGYRDDIIFGDEEDEEID